MIFPRRHALTRAFVLLAALPLFAACENSATSMIVENKDHALVLVREQPYFWSDEVVQYIIVSRLPGCQRRVKIHPDKAMMAPVAVYEAGHLLWALNQGGRWYLASTEGCQVQDWNNPGSQPPGSVVGRFGQSNGKVVFTPTAPAP
ncbi:MAG: hypothetical protein FWG26_02740 [Betaproteobacteria bacterium]|jgi:hypothetical protein|nr:hypothetical protein [Betaproteobacteria bacterium]